MAQYENGGRGGSWRGRGGFGAGHPGVRPPPDFASMAPPDFLTDAERRVAQRYQLARTQGVVEKRLDLPAVPVSSIPFDPALLFSSPATPRLRELDVAKQALNTTKSKLDSKDIKVWSRHTDETSLLKDAVFACRKDLHIEMCTIAWLKMFEMLCSFDLVPKVDQSRPGSSVFRSVHVCEAPGAFICATNHYVETQRPGMSWDWLANSLNPDFEGNDLNAMLDEDKFIRQTAPHWFFGADNSGDIMSPANVRSLWARARARFPEGVMLVTGDGSINCQDNPNEQEAITSPLHFCEFVAGVGLLARGGAMVLKAFTVFENDTVALIYLMAALFDRVSVCKPPSSKPGNSETYLIGCGFRGVTEEQLEALAARIGPKFPEGRAVYPLERMDRAVLGAIKVAGLLFGDFQRETIERNLALEHTHEWKGKNRFLKSHIAWAYMHRRLPLVSLPRDRTIVAKEGGVAFLNGVGNNTGRTIGEGAKRARTEGSLEQRKLAKLEGGGDGDGGGGEGGGGGGGGGGAGAGAGDAAASARLDPARDAKAIALMKSMGWTEGAGLGRSGQGIAAPIEVEMRSGALGLGFESRGAAALPSAAAGGKLAAAKVRKVEDFASAPATSTLARHVATTAEGIAGAARYEVAAESDRARVVRLSRFCDDHAISRLLGARTSLVEAQGRRPGDLWICDAVAPAADIVRLLFAELDSACSLTQGLARDDRILEAAEYWRGSAAAPSDKGIVRTTDEAAAPFGLVLDDAMDPPVAANLHPGDPDRQANLDLEWRCKDRLLQRVSRALASLGPGGSLVLRCPELHSRLSVGVAYLLHACFARVAVRKPALSDPSAPDRFLVCVGLEASPDLVAACRGVIDNALTSVVTTGSGESRLHPFSLLSVDFMNDDAEFRAWMITTNEILAEREAQGIALVRSPPPPEQRSARALLAKLLGEIGAPAPLATAQELGHDRGAQNDGASDRAPAGARGSLDKADQQ